MIPLLTTQRHSINIRGLNRKVKGKWDTRHGNFSQEVKSDMHTRRRHLIRYIDNDGKPAWIEVPGTTSRRVRELLKEEPTEMREALIEPRTIESYSESHQLTGAMVRGSAEAIGRYWGGPGFAWEGPRFGFSLTYGVQEIWEGDRRTAWFWKVAPQLELVAEPREIGWINGEMVELPAKVWILEVNTSTWLSDRALTEDEAREGLDWILGQESESLGGLRELRCRFCGHRKTLESIACCLGCQRTGRDGEIEPATVADLTKRREAQKIYRPNRKIRGGRR